MNPAANDATAQNSVPSPVGGNGRGFPGPPAASSPSPPVRRAGGGRSTLKLMVPVVALVAVIFGVTFFAQYTPPSEDSEKANASSGDEPPLRFFTSTRHYDPPSLQPPSRYQPLDYRGLPLLAPSAMPLDPDFPFRFSPQNRAFQAFYEPNDGIKHSTTFWFENPNPRPVTMVLQYVSCGACSGAKVAAIPPDVTRQLLQMSRISILPQGLTTGLPLGMVGPAANLDEPRLTWQHQGFIENPGASFKFPPAGDNPDGWTPQWGILKLEFSVQAPSTKKLDLVFRNSVDGTEVVKDDKFWVVTEGMNSFELTRNEIKLGELTDRSRPRTFEVIAFSSTRGPAHARPGGKGDLPPPLASVRMPQSQGGDPGEFIRVSAPERIPEAELGQVADLIAKISEGKRFARVEAAYRYTVSFDPRADDRSIDIGLLQREIWFSLDAGEPRKVQVTGMVSGSVWLDGNLNEIVMPDSSYSVGFTKTFRLITARRSLEVGLVEKETKPNTIKVALEKDPNPPSADRGYYKLTVRVLSSTENRSVGTGTWSGEIVLEVKGSTAQRIRIPIKGRIVVY